MKVKITAQSANVQEFYGHGKLLITGEYFVLDGALALSLPTNFGQHLKVTSLSSNEGIMYWVALNNQGKPWLNLVFDTSDFSCLNSKQPEAERLTKILIEARKLNPAFLQHAKDLAVETRLEFPNQWGLGTSSTLIYCVSTWAQVDGYKLLQSTLGGSGYDVACAGANGPILYKLIEGKPETIQCHWQPSFSDNIYFAYLGKKQLSSEGIKYYKEKLTDKSHTVAQLSRITDELLKTTTLQNFELLVNEHETIVGSQLKMIRVAERLFPDYWASVKSLGAWGGDFVMLTNEKSEEELKKYLLEKNIDTVFNWKELILSNNP